MFNICILSGQISSEPEVKCYGEYNPITSFTLSFKLRQECWIRVFCPDGLAAKAEKYLEKGDRVVILGFLYRDFDVVADDQLCLVAFDLEFFRGVGFSHKA